MKQKLLQVFALVLVIGIWEVACRNATSQSLQLTAPSVSLMALFEMIASGEIFQHLVASLLRVLLGFAIAMTAGIGLGFLFGLLPLVGGMFRPLFEMVRPIPPIAWIPLAVAILGMGDKPAILVIFIGAFFPVLTNTVLGVAEISQELIDVAKTLGASRFRVLRRVIWPASLPHIFAGIKVGVGFGWMCVVAAEMVGAQSGMGYIIQLNRQLLYLDKVVAGMVAIGVVGFAVIWAVMAIERRALTWRFSEARGETGRNNSNIDIEEAELEAVDTENVTGVLKSIMNKRSSPKPQGARMTVDDLNYSYPDGTRVLSHVSIDVEPGTVFCLLGESGCGKTTLLRIIAGLAATQGSRNVSIIEGDNLLPPGNPHTCMMFQSLALFHWLRARDNVAFPLEIRGYSKSAAREVSDRLLKVMGIGEKAETFPAALSGGQRQRVALARALAATPSLLLMDEPFSALDTILRQRFWAEFSEMFEALHVTVILVTHDIEEAIFLSDHVAVMQPDKDGHPDKDDIVDLVPVRFSKPRRNEIRESAEFDRLRLRLADSLRRKVQPYQEGGGIQTQRKAKREAIVTEARR